MHMHSSHAACRRMGTPLLQALASFSLHTGAMVVVMGTIAIVGL